ncbi:MAG: alpha/beta hydrolase-fold protein [Pirellulales bacterium]
MNGNWTKIDVAGHACDVYEPPARNPHGYVVIYLHGVHLGRVDQNPIITGELARHGLAAIAPFTARSWWTDKICPEFDTRYSAQHHLLEHVLPYVHQRWQTSSPRIALLGTSMGGQGGLRFAFKFPNKFPIVAAIAPAIDYQVRFHDEDEETLPQMYPDAEAARQDTATLHVHPLNWPRNIWFACDPADHRWHESAEKLRMKLAALGIPHECDLETSAGGHGWAYYNHVGPAAIAFIADRLEKERLRLL